jgi:hypothetical protein
MRSLATAILAIFPLILLRAENVLQHDLVCRDGKVKIVTNTMSADTGQIIFTYQLVYQAPPSDHLKIPITARWSVNFEIPKDPIIRVAAKEYLRADRRPFALCWPHPAKDGRLLVILDGRPAWTANGLPLAGLPDLLIGGLQPEDPPAVERLFGNDWR